MKESELPHRTNSLMPDCSTIIFFTFEFFWGLRENVCACIASRSCHVFTRFRARGGGGLHNTRDGRMPMPQQQLRGHHSKKWYTWSENDPYDREMYRATSSYVPGVVWDFGWIYLFLIRPSSEASRSVNGECIQIVDANMVDAVTLGF